MLQVRSIAGKYGHSLEYRPDIDGLRAAAVLAVVLFHAFPTLLPGGFIGVDVFFVISGYLISAIILKDIQLQKFSFMGFYARRFRRIVPALMITLAATWILGYSILLSSELSNLGRHIFAGATFTSNILLKFEAGYFDTAAEYKPLLHLWSLGVEEQFYLLWPVLLALCLKFRRNVWILIGALFTVSFTLNVAYVHHNPSSTFYLLPTRFWELLIGCGLALFEKKHNANAGLEVGITEHKFAYPLLNDAKSICGGALLILAIALVDETKAFPGWWALLPTLAAFFLIAAGPRALINRLLLSSKPAVLIGLISYPFYLWHWPLLSMLYIAEEGHPSIEMRLLAVAVSAILAFATWRLIERPVQKKLFADSEPEMRSRKLVVCGLATLTICGSVGVFTILQGGFRTRYEYAEAIQNQMQWSPQGAERCRRQYRTNGICWSTQQQPQIILWGESHAEMLLPGMAANTRDTRRSVILLGRYGCPPLYDIDVYNGSIAQNCNENVAKDRTIIEQQLQKSTTVVLVSRGPNYFTGQGFGIELQEHNPPLRLRSSRAEEKSLTGAQLFMEGYSRTISFLESLGKEVIFFTDVPELGFKPTDCLDTRPLRIAPKATRHPCGIAFSTVQQRQKEYRLIIQELKHRHPRLKVFDPTPYLCDAQLCYATLPGAVLYRDDDHLGTAGSKYIAGHFLAWLDGFSGLAAPNGTITGLSR